MENEHGAYFDHEFILATCMMDDDEKKAVKSVIISKYFDENTNIVVDDDNIEIKKEPDEEFLMVEETKKQQNKRSRDKEITLDISTKEEPLGKVRKVRNYEDKSNNSMVEKQVASLPVVSFRNEKNKSVCSDCDASFEKEEYLKIHEKIMHSTEASKSRFYCTECDSSFTRKDNLTLHKKKKHETQKKLITEKVEQTVPKILAQHWAKAVSNPSPVKVDKFIKTEKSSPVKLPTPTESPAKDTESEKDNCICGPCNLTFSQRGNLTRHNKKFHPDLISVLDCKDCDKAFTRMDNLTKHIKTMHPDSVPSDKCDQCDYSNPRKDRLKRHKETIHGKTNISPEKKIGNNFETEDESLQKDTKVEVKEDAHSKKLISGDGKPKAKNDGQKGSGEGKEYQNLVSSHSPLKQLEDEVKSKMSPIKTPPKNNVIVNQNALDKSVSIKEASPRQHASARTSFNKPKYITNYPCDKCPKVFSDRTTILEHVKDAHGIVVPPIDKKAEEAKKQQKFWQTKAKELEDPEVNVENASEKDETKNQERTNKEPETESAEALVEDPLNVPDQLIVPKVEKLENPEEKVVITPLDGDASKYFIENIEVSALDPLSNNSEDIDDPEPVDDQANQNSSVEETTEDQESSDDSSDELEVQQEMAEVAEMHSTEEIDKSKNKSEEELNKDHPPDISKSKYFKMNSYTICSLDLYTSGVEEDFEECFDLPEGWKFKSFGPGSNPKKLTHFITPDKKVIKSRLGAIEYMRLTGKYSKQELWEYSKYLNVPDRRFEQLFQA